MTQASPWIRNGDVVRCTRHSVEFSLPSTCDQCAADPFPPPSEIDIQVEPPDGCLSLTDIERWFVSIAKEARASAKNPDEDFHVDAAIAKHRDVAIKAMRGAAELAMRRTDEAIVNAREKRIQDRAQAEASH